MTSKRERNKTWAEKRFPAGRESHKHDSCSCYIKRRYHKNRPDLVPGLYCQEHQILIKWLREEEVDLVKSLGVPEHRPDRGDLEQLARPLRSWELGI